MKLIIVLLFSIALIAETECLWRFFGRIRRIRIFRPNLGQACLATNNPGICRATCNAGETGNANICRRGTCCVAQATAVTCTPIAAVSGTCIAGTACPVNTVLFSVASLCTQAGFVCCVPMPATVPACAKESTNDALTLSGTCQAACTAGGAFTGICVGGNCCIGPIAAGQACMNNAGVTGTCQAAGCANDLAAPAGTCAAPEICCS